MPNDAISLTREELYERVWSEPMSSLSPKFDLSDVGLAKICRKMRIPRPPRGYWARKNAGQKVSRTPLPRLSVSADAKMRTVTLRAGTVSRGDGLAQTDGPTVDQERFEAAKSNRIAVADRIQDPHPLVARSIVAFRRAKPDEQGLLKAKGECLDVRVTLDSSDRAMCILDALLKGLDTRGYPVTIRRTGDNFSTTVCIIDEDIGISLVEQVTRIELKDEKRKQSVWAFRQYEWVPTGKLSLRIEAWSPGARQSWSDGKQQRVENCLNQFIVGLVVVAEAARAARLEREEREREYRKAEEERLLKLRRQEEEAARIRALIHAADQWHTASNVRSYLARVRESLEHHPDVPLEVRDWLDWAEEFTNQIDPLLAAPSIPTDPHPPERFRHAW
jgi:hypothetical protein